MDVPRPGTNDRETPRGGASRYPKGVARRQEILDRTIEVFATNGAERTSLRAIADAIGVSHAALLHYFASREELLVEVLREDERVRGGSHDESEIVSVMLNAAERNVSIPGLVALYSTMLAGSLETDKTVSREYFVPRFERIRTMLIERISAGQKAGTVRADVEPEAMAALIIAASDGLQTQWLLEPKVDIAKSLALLNRILEP
ncbi:AcrR family transcriptional regulator [Conyzicola nivalis]|uniref:AcrR family transcriptional regulator n=1 Tax=Conyzicola nivalis TaxID=1477021 RepID=A0ABV2QQ70_9MICO